MNLSQDQFDPTDPQPQIPRLSHDPAAVGPQDSESVSRLCSTTDERASDDAQPSLWNQDDEPSTEEPAALNTLRPNDDNAFEPTEITPDDGATRHSKVPSRQRIGSAGREGRSEELLRRWVQTAVSDPKPGCIRQHYICYRAWVFQTKASGEDVAALSYSAFCRRVAALKDHRSAVRRARFNVDYRALLGAARQPEGQEALWIRQLPSQHAAPWDPPPLSDKPATVCIAVDAITGVVRVDSQLVGTYPSDVAAVAAVNQYERQHGRVPYAVCVDGADFHHAPGLTRLCHQWGIELRLVHERRAQRQTTRQNAVSPLRQWKSATEYAGPSVTGKSHALSKLRRLHADGLHNALRDTIRDISQKRNSPGRLRDLGTPGSQRSIWPRKADDRANGEEGQP